MKSNPWKGLRPYEFDDASAFYGRNTEILQLTSLIEYNQTVTLYGKSGIGKSSLLKAGVFPWLKLNGYSCYYLRLNELDAKDKFSFINEINFKTKNHSKDDSVVIVLDQFEEVLRSNISNTELLLNHIAFNKFSSEDSCDLHFVISIREDDFFLLEDCIDKFALNSLKSNRFRLKELSYDSAKEIISSPSGDLFDNNEIDEISERIISAVKNLCNSEISTVFLSFICSRIYSTFQKDRISANDIDEFLNNNRDFISLFFEELKQKLNNEDAWEFLEENLVANDGRRTVATLVVYNHEFKDKNKLLLEGDYSILKTVNFRGNECVELVHDILAVYLLQIRNKRIEHEKVLKKQKQIKIVSGILVVFSIFTLSLVSSYCKMNKAEDNFLLNESRYLAYAADDILEEGENITMPLRLMLYALPDNLKNPSRPHSIEAESILRLADLKLNISPINYVIDFRNLRDVEISYDDKYILLANESKIGLYDSYTGKEIRSLSVEKKLMRAKFKHSSNNILLVYEDYTVSEVNLFESAKDVENINLPISADHRNISFAQFSHDGSLVAYRGFPGDSIFCYNLNCNNIVSKLPYGLVIRKSGFTIYHNPKTTVFSKNSTNILQTYYSGHIRVFNIGSSSDITPKDLLNSVDVKYCAFATDYFFITHHINNIIKFWDLTSGECIHELLVDFTVDDLCVNSKGDKLIINSVNRSVNGRIIDLRTFSDLIDSSKNETNRFFQKGYFCTDSSLLLISELGSQTFSSLFKLIKNNDNYLRNKRLTHFSTNNKFVLSQENHSVYCFNLSNLKQCFGYTHIDTLVKVNDNYYIPTIKQAILSEDNNSLFLFTSEGCLMEYDISSGKMLNEEIISDRNFTIYKFSHYKNYLAIADPRYKGTGVQVKIYDINNRHFKTQFSTGQSGVEKLLFTPNGEHIICLTNNGAYVYNYVKNEFNGDNPLKIVDIDLCYENNMAVTLNSSSEFSIWNLSDSSKMISVSLPEEVNKISISKNGKYVLTFSNNKLRVWDVVTGIELSDKMLQVDNVNYAQFSNDCNYLFISCSDGIKIYDFNTMYEMYPGVLDGCSYYEFLAETNNILLFDSARNLYIYKIKTFDELVAKYKNDKSCDWTLSDAEIEQYKLNGKYQ